MRKARHKKLTLWQTFIRTPGNSQLLLGLALIAGLLILLNSGNSVDRLPSKATEVQPAITAQADLAAAPEVAATPSPQPLALAIPLPESSAVQPLAIPAPVTDITPQPDVPMAKLVIILDDIGYNADAGLRAIQLPAQITLAVIPHTPHGKVLAEAAHSAGRELMLHAPMSNVSGMDLGQGGLTLQQNEEEFLDVFRQALADIPHIKGVNNHTGSELTAAAQPMQWVMQELKKRDLYFVDSMTTRESVAATTAEQFLVPSLRRHVFLDNTQTEVAIDNEFKRAIALAKQQGYAVAIGHPYPETLAYLESALPLLAAQHVEVVSVSAMLAQVHASRVETTAAW